MPIEQEVIDQLTGVFQEDSRIQAAYLHGSALNDGFRPDSDVDIALLLADGRTLSGIERFDLAERLSAICHHTVDLALLDSAQLIYANQAILRGKRIHCRDEADTDNRIAVLLGLYLDLKFDRRAVESAYVA
ncbi:MAG: type VII toxin-antitoxin system MntA family adenylyltransferase antitoxin [Planctomycetota bacterium]|jgi:predicted nucleotidyltransferase